LWQSFFLLLLYFDDIQQIKSVHQLVDHRLVNFISPQKHKNLNDSICFYDIFSWQKKAVAHTGNGPC